MPPGTVAPHSGAGYDDQKNKIWNKILDMQTTEHIHMHGEISNQFIDFCKPQYALIYTIAGVEARVADGVGLNKSRDAPGVEHEPSKVRC